MLRLQNPRGVPGQTGCIFELTTGVGENAGGRLCMTISTHDETVPCVENPDLFLDDRFEKSPNALSEFDQLQVAKALRFARKACSECPAFKECLYKSVVETEVFGIAAGTTPQQREAIRVELELDRSMFDHRNSERRPRANVDHRLVVSVARQFPNDNIDQLARRLNCSPVTVKRHLKKAQANNVDMGPIRKPTQDEVLGALERVVGKYPIVRLTKR